MSTMTTVVNGHEIRSRGRETGTHEQLPRSASYTCVPILHPNQAYVRKPPVPITIKGSFSEDDLIASIDNSTDVSPPESSGWSTPLEEQKVHSSSQYDLVAELHKSPKISISRYTPSSEDEASSASINDGKSSLESATVPSTVSSSTSTIVSSDLSAAPVVSPAPSPSTTSAVSTERLQASSYFARRLSRKLSQSPSLASSRSPSPLKRYPLPGLGDDGHDAAPSPPAVGSLSFSRKKVLRKRESLHESGEAKLKGGLLSRSSTILRRKSTVKPPKQQVELPVRASMETAKPQPAVPALPKSFSTDRLLYGIHTHHDRPMPMPLPVSADKLSSFGPLSAPRKRDELWSVFRSLDGDYTKYFMRHILRSPLAPC